MVEVNEQIDVPATPRVVWDLLSNPRAVVDCVPGASLGEQHEDGSYDSGVTVKFGPARVTFNARIALTLDHATMSGQVASRGKDNQGGTKFNATMGFAVTGQAESTGSTIRIDARVEIAGKLASIVESGAKLVINRMTSEFSQRLAARCAEITAA